jgi:chemotaxis regulatin CheY-phosphate phosphatase CheZ
MLDQDEINALLSQSDDNDTQDDSVQEKEPEKIEESKKVQELVGKIDNNEMIDFGSQTWVEEKIDKEELPYPVEPPHKVVDQLSQVTQDGEIKAGEVFDSIFEACEKLGDIDTMLDKLNTQCSNIDQFITVLSNKFKSVDIFSQKSTEIKNILSEINTIQENSSTATNALYKAMETMQYQDISRQKIERVISVIRKLSSYLNNVFEDNNQTEDIKVAKHIHGDDTSGLTSGDDIDSLIEEFGTI